MALTNLKIKSQYVCRLAKRNVIMMAAVFN